MIATNGGTTAPTVTDARISISGATGTGGIYKIGDTVTATWNNTAGGDNNSGITGVTMDFSQFGGGAAVVASNSSETWTATYTLVAGAVDTTNRNVSVTATNGTPTTTADTTNASVDIIAPTVTDVSAPTSRTYKAGDNIDFIVTTSTVVTVSGTAPSIGLTLDTGGIANATYLSGSTTRFLTFRYTVDSNDLDSTGIGITSPIALNGGTIQDGSNNDLTLTFSAPTLTSVLVDGVAPTVTNVTSSTSDGTYTTGSVVSIQVQFSEVVKVNGDAPPRLTLETGTTDRFANYAYIGNNTNTLTFRYTVVAGDTSTDLDYVATDSLNIFTSSIYDAALNNANATLPAPGAGNSLGANKAIVINASPTFTGGANTGLVVPEDASITTITTAMLEVKDAEQAAAALTYTVSTAPTKGVLSNNGSTVSASGTFTQADIDSNLIKYTPNANANGIDNVSFSVSDGAGGTLSSRTFSISVTAVNDAPTLADTVLTMTAELEDAAAPSGAVGTLVSSLVGGISDVDAGAVKGIAITAADTTNGTWWYSTDNGTNWSALGAVSGSSARLVASANGRLYFQPNANWNGSVSPAITFVAWDTTSSSNGATGVDPGAGGGTTAFSTASDTATLTITAANDAPTRTAGSLNAVTVNEDSSNATATTLGLTAVTYGPGGGSD
ncbi:MAG: hypothetical protein JZU60_02520, partial [Ilumatobacteraceae bacterium]|nr:hypothetical protein [Ilumatobacteraceae bacterium]